MKAAIRQLLFGARSTNDPVKALFARGERGLWYDPSDLSTLSQDSAGGTPVTAFTQPVGRMRDKSGCGNDATQATAGNRPTVDATGLVCAAAKTMVTPGFLDASFNNAFSLFAVIRTGAGHVDNRVVFAASAPTAYVGINGSNNNFDFTTSLVGDGTGVMNTDGILQMVVGSGQYSLGIDRWWFQNSNAPKSASASVSTKTSGVSGSLGFAAGASLVIGGLTTASFLWPGSIGEFICLNREVTRAERKRVLSYLTQKWNQHNKPLIVCCGNSLTSGQGSTGGATQLLSTTGNNYPSRVLNALSASYDVRTDAYPGRTLAQMLAESPSFTDLMTVAPGNRKIAIVWEISNSLAQGQNPTTTLSELAAYCQARKSEGFSVLVGTCLNRGDAVYANFNTDRQALNTSILANFAGYADGVVDFAGVANLTDVNNATYFNADKIHLTDAGYQAAADAVTAKIAAMGW